MTKLVLATTKKKPPAGSAAMQEKCSPVNGVGSGWCTTTGVAPASVPRSTGRGEHPRMNPAVPDDVTAIPTGDFAKAVAAPSLPTTSTR